VEVPKVTQLIECDPIISSKVLALANSPIYCPSRPIVTINHAVVILGFRSVAKLVLTVATSSVFADKSTPCIEDRLRTLRESLAIASVARVVADQNGTVDSDEAFLAGVMHDVGKLVLFNADGEAYSEMIDQHPTGDSTDAEREQYGVTHPELGKTCGSNWGVPHDINVAINNHHLELDEVSDELSATIIRADYLARAWRLGFESPSAFVANEAMEAELESLIQDGELRSKTAEEFEAISDLCLG
ncbi:MAG: HDOD domain-containing protein, partial [Planctomycetota bacterium]